MTEVIVTAEEFARYADQFLGEFKCEVCGTKAWSLVLDPNRDAGVVYRGDHGGSLLSIPALSPARIAET